MLSQSVFLSMVTLAWGWSSPNQVFLSAYDSPEGVGAAIGPNMHFEPLSTTMKCTINLTIQYMVVFTALGICRTYLDFTGGDHEKSSVQKALKHASDTVFYAPMVCLMFVGFRMRVLQLTKGQGNPQDWCRMAMEGVAYAILTNTVLVLVVAMFSNTEPEVDERGEVKEIGKDTFSMPILATIFNVVRYVAFLALYVGFGAVCTGVFLFEPEAGVWEGPIPPLSPAVACTMALATTFFLVYFLHALSRTWSQYSGGNTSESDFEKLMVRCADTMGMAPMLCVLFLGARMRALQMDPTHGNPQRWAQNCFYTCSYALVAQTIVAAFVQLVLKKGVKKGHVEGELDYEFSAEEQQGFLAKGLTAFRFIIMLCVYVAMAAVVCSVFTIEHPQGKELTPPLSPTMLCVINLAFQYFLIYFLLWAFITWKDFTGMEWKAGMAAIESAKSTVRFAPMLSVLFIATRMRALQITQNKGAPQGWVQDGMYLATWSVMIQFMMCLVMPLFTGKTFTPDSLDGEQTTKVEVQNTFGKYIVVFIRYFALLAMLGGVTTVITGVVLMTPETANGRGALPLVGDGTLPIDIAAPPPSVQDIPGAKGAMKATGETVGAGVNAVNDGGEAVTGTVTG